MKLSPVLRSQHLGWHFKRLWALRSKRLVVNNKIEENLVKSGITVYDPEEFLKEPPMPKFDVVGYKPKPQAFDKTHPNWHDRVLLTYKDNNVLVEGLAQAKILTKTVEIGDGGLPVTLPSSTKDLDKRVRDIILECNVYDAEQETLPKYVDPVRPAHKFARIYGITERRSIKLMLPNLLQLLELKSGLAKDRFLTDDLPFSYNFSHSGELVQFELNGDTVLTSSKPLQPITSDYAKDTRLPDLYPVKATITLNKENIYVIRNVYPIDLSIPKSHPHTIFVHNIKDNVKNLFEEEVTEPQIYGRSLLKAFTVAASYAKQKYGNDADKMSNLPQPITIQCVQTNGRLWHFGMFQLNTLDLQNGDSKNLWYQTGMLPLFNGCSYVKGRPTLTGYNNEVVKHLVAFYNNV